ncbi:MAG: tRNA (N6-isopentenyl adenosine(37)-C2)-methylthiotransferase MiaB [Eubacterium coprostanoligenes]|uniref:tRNA (N6-isopentenyl adenosine(37)-C2)-methylthiotransferase MiaB n=1 Tax=Eubacterium coprostanoligenes TaxID=290054 RepID=UPI0023559903|nr:tRNA (N6-isopentenyl adenosine(37)-C2)-methylthiotransferase MiaB [Eubacterium coprostanoligenes]MCI7265465.1 tRNA (N6-isopentenyl adenosine(37)-C2)-methylthiotransferase MiaB [Eubacterium coprostanoligenes]MDD7358139.1 tRNA (N6-isopentenyl adenosine(37)-C2)-methylthiotransferase MiaB [Eubacterium coprostanoligenes]
MPAKIKKVSDEELEVQRQFAHKVNELISKRYSSKPLACVVTYGCQQNVADSEHIKGMLEAMGYGFTEERTEAKLIIFNTCAVREHAEDRVFGNVGALKKYKLANPDVVIALCGCMMQQQHIAEKIKKSFPFVDLVFGTHVVYKVPELIYSALTKNRRVFELPDVDGVIAEGIPVKRDNDKKAWIPIMYGCNNFCSYCIVPYVRGRERSREVKDVVAEFKSLVDDGYKEITLLGQNVNSYGKDLEPKVSFSELLRMLNELDGDFRIRFMTSHPKDCTKELIETMAECDKVATHLHLPFQSGNDRVLKAMNRSYTREKYLSLINYAKELMGDELSITSDIIVGFPGETYEEFCDTKSLVEEIKATSLFTFIYSARKGTPAAEMDDPVPYEEKSKWMRELLALQERISGEQMALHKGKVFKCFVYGKGKQGDNYLAARTDGNLIIEFVGDEGLIGTFQKIKVTEPLTYVMLGELERNDL